MRNLTVKDFLSLKPAAEIRLVAGAKGQERVITSVNIMDNPDTARWLSEGELLLTTGFVFVDDPALQANLIQQLAQRRCAGLGLKIKRYFETIPQQMIDQAEACDFPLLELPFEYSLSQISFAVYQEILNRQAALLSKSRDIHNCLTRVSLAGGSLEEIVQTLVELIGNPVLVLDSQWRLLASGDLPKNEPSLEECLPLIKGQRLFSEEFISDIPQEAGSWERSIKRQYPCQRFDVACRIKPVAATGNIYGYIVVWESVRKLTQLDYVAVEHAATIIALERLKEQAIAETKHRLRRDFFDDLLAGKIESVNAIRTLGEIHGLCTDKPYCCLVIELYPGQRTQSSGSWAMDTYYPKEGMVSTPSLEKVISWRVERELSRAGNGAVVIVRTNRIIVFLPLSSQADRRTIRDNSKDLAGSLSRDIREDHPWVRFSIGIGRPCPSILDLKQSFMEALEAIKMSRKVAATHPIAHFDDFLIYHLLDSGGNAGELENFFQNTVGKLVSFDEENNTDLVKTLEAFFASRGNISSAAKELFIHRNTMMYRLDRIKLILGVDLADPEQLLELNLGLKIMNLLLVKKMDSQ
ncbi:MAG: PucR family transcriptional regulator [Firmicutes bacterium]|nr:PucR family transcriptional regulator [Bacillota bacterium]